MHPYLGGEIRNDGGGQLTGDLPVFPAGLYAIDKVLHLEPRVPGDFRAFLSTATGYGTVGVRAGKPFLDVKAGKIDVQKIEYEPLRVDVRRRV